MKGRTITNLALGAAISLLGMGCATPGDTAALGILVNVLSQGAADPNQARALAVTGQGLQHLSRTQAIAAK